jgi:hypothetical protein
MPTHSFESTGFAAPTSGSHPRHGSLLPVLIATLSLGVSIAIVLTATMSARAVQLF